MFLKASQMVSGSQSQHDEMLLQMQEMNSQMLELELRVRDVEAENARLQSEVEARHYEKVCGFPYVSAGMRV